MARNVVVTGGGAGVGRATARAFAADGCNVAVLSRDPDRLAATVAELRGMGVRAIGIPTDVADHAAVETAADQVEHELGPIDVWVNNAMATVFAPVHDTTAEEFRRGTEVTYLGTVHGTLAALKRMRHRRGRRGTIINVGSALAYRSVPLQAVYCGAKSAIRGFTDSLRSEILHDRDAIDLIMVHLPAVNTPQFNWARNKMGRRSMPVPPIFEPEVPARAIVYAAHHPRREYWVGFPTIKAIMANRIAPAFADRYLASHGYTGQLTHEKQPTDAPDNLFQPVPGSYAAHGRFDAQARPRSWEMFTSRHRLGCRRADRPARRRAPARPPRRGVSAMADTHYDIIVVGSGPGGASLAHRLAPSLAAAGKRLLMLERGDYLPRTPLNWDSRTVFVEGAYQARETWHGADGGTFRPGLHYYVGGNSKVYGAALFRLRERDFGEVRHKGGISPEWPVGYDIFEPYYTEAERLYAVHGQRGEDPDDPWASAAYPHPPVTHEPRIQQLADTLADEGLHPYHLPLGILLDERNGGVTPTSRCIRCDAFDGFPCLLNGKADAQVMCIDPTLAAYPDTFTLLTGAYAERLETDPSGRRVTAVRVQRAGAVERYTADVVVVACGALSSALLMLRSANDKHPAGLANRTNLVGRNYMRHEMSVQMALLKEPNPTVFQKTLALGDFYFGADDWDFPLGLIQMCAKSHPDQIRGESLPAWLEWLPSMPFDKMAAHALDFWLQTEDLPRPENRIYYDGDRVVLDVTATNTEAAARLKQKLRRLLGVAGAHPVLLERELYFGKDIPVSGTAHQAGTMRFGTDPTTSVLDLHCRAHDLDNLYITDASFFPSIGAVNPTLTIIANALRVADHLKSVVG